MIKLLLTALLSLGIWVSPKTYFQKPKENVYTLTEGQVQILYNANIQVKMILPTSQAPAIQVTNLNASIDSINKVLATQWQKFHPDTNKVNK